MLSQANQEIRHCLDAAEARRRLRRETEAPMRYLDWVLGRLEAYRLQGQTRVPDAFYAQLQQTRLALPAGVKAPTRWANRVGWAVEQCFRLQGQLLRVRRSDFGRGHDRASAAPEPVRPEAVVRAPVRLRVRAPASPSADRLWWAARERGRRAAVAPVAPARRQPHVYA